MEKNLVTLRTVELRELAKVSKDRQTLNIIYSELDRRAIISREQTEIWKRRASVK